MYNLILNVWFTTWDFVGLDAVVTPLVGLLALGGGIFFLYRYRKNRKHALVCDITDLETQGKTTQKIKDLIRNQRPSSPSSESLQLHFRSTSLSSHALLVFLRRTPRFLKSTISSFISRQMYILMYTAWVHDR
jgi:hypothetical protein